jgi:cob(I)alamin adenosyltransferase
VREHIIKGTADPVENAGRTAHAARAIGRGRLGGLYWELVRRSIAASPVPRSAMKIYTKTGDKGSTGLFGGGRVAKDDLRVEAYGDVDELNAVLGMARAIELMPRIDEVLVPVQRDLFAIGALLATPDREKMAAHLSKARIDDGRIAELEQAIDDGEAELEPLSAFILPGGTPKAAALHVARTVCRRAERHVVRLQHEVELPPLAVIYLNRLSDLLFTLARLANRRAGAGEVTW